MKAMGIFSKLFEKKTPEAASAAEIIASPLTGEVIPIEKVADQTFADKVMGDGLAVIPSEGKLYAPAEGTALNVPDTKHALCILTKGGAELLIHVGRDTVALKGKHFEMKVAEGQKVKNGDLLLEFDLEALTEAGYDLTTPVILTNGFAYEMQKRAPGRVAHGDEMLTLTKSE